MSQTVESAGMFIGETGLPRSGAGRLPELVQRRSGAAALGALRCMERTESGVDNIAPAHRVERRRFITPGGFDELEKPKCGLSLGTVRGASGKLRSGLGRVHEPLVGGDDGADVNDGGHVPTDLLQGRPRVVRGEPDQDLRLKNPKAKKRDVTAALVNPACYGLTGLEAEPAISGT